MVASIAGSNERADFSRIKPCDHVMSGSGFRAINIQVDGLILRDIPERK